MAAMNIPLVPVNSEAKTFAASALVQAINNMHLAQNASGGGAGHSAATAQQTKEQKEIDAAAQKAALLKHSRGKIEGQVLGEEGGMEPTTMPAPAISVTPPAPVAPAAPSPTIAAPSSGVSFGAMTDINPTPASDAGPATQGGGFNSDSMFDWGSMFGGGL
jgi:hypothetical protein